jgi:hypothetical protein
MTESLGSRVTPLLMRMMTRLLGYLIHLSLIDNQSQPQPKRSSFGFLWKVPKLTKLRKISTPPQMNKIRRLIKKHRETRI